jgi:hypothetical protein
MRPSHLVIPFYLVATLVLTWPLARGFSSHLPSVYGPADALLQVFLLGWGWHGFTTYPLDVFNAPIFHPEVRTLTYMDHMLGEAVVAGPIAEVFGLGAAYNSLVIFSFVASGYFVYRLARLYGVSRSGSCLAGFLFAFAPYRFSSLGFLNQLQTQFVPLGIFFAVRFLRTERARYGVGAALTVVVQSYFGWYATFHLVLALGLFLAWEIARDRRRSLPWRKMVTLAVLSAVLVAPGVMPYLVQRMAMPEFRRSIGSTALWSADLLDYLHLNPENVLVRLVPPLGDAHGLFPGLVATVLAAVAIVAMRRAPVRATRSAESPRRGLRSVIGRVRVFRKRGEMGYFSLLGLSGLLLSLGPILQVAGHRLWIPLPFALCFFVIPGFSSMRAPVRFAVLVALAAAVLAGLGFDHLRRRFPNLGSSFLVVLLLVAGILAWCPDLPFVAYPDRASMPPVYAWLAEQPDADPVLELPVPADQSKENAMHARRQMYILYHGKPRLDGVSGFASKQYDAFRLDIQSFPGPEAIRRAHDLGARRLIVHYGDYEPAFRKEMRRRAGAAEDLREVAVFGDDVVYEIE